MPPIDPQKLLTALGPLLTNDGGIKGAREATRIAPLMKDASKLVSRCIYLNILRATNSSDAIEKFIEVGGWDILNNWLDLSRTDNNDPLLGEILEVYHNLPVTVNLLKKNTAAKTIKHLTKTDNEKIKSMSSKLVDLWTKTIRNNKDEEDAKDKLKKKDKEKERSEKDKENDKKEKKESEKHRSSDKDRHRDKDRRDRDRHKGKDREKESRSKDSKSKSSSESSKSSSKSSSSSHSSSSSKSKDNSLKKITPPEEAKASSVPSESKPEEENRLRPKTVKRVKNNFRSTGLFDEDDDDESEQTSKKSDKLPSKRVGLDLPNEESSEKKPRLQLSMPTLTPANLDPINTTPPEVQHGRIKIIPAKRASNHEIQESNVFMNALQKSTYTTGIKRKKKLASVSTPPPSSLGAPSLLHSLTSSSATSPPPSSSVVEKGATSPPILSPTTAQIQKLPSVPSFYRDTLDDMPEPTETKEKDDQETAGPPVIEGMEVTPPLLPPQTDPSDADSALGSSEGNSGESKEESNDGADKAPELDTEPKRKSTNPKKSVTWARESYLEEFFYFELDETERENVNRPKSFLEMKREEMLLDKRAMESARRTSNDIMEPVLPWRRPKLIDDIIAVVDPGKESKQRLVQTERERAVLCALFFNKVPDTPTEPDIEIPLEDEEMKLIPLEDETGACTEYEHTYTFEDPSSLPYDPEFGLPMPGGPPMNPAHINNNGNMGNLNNMVDSGFNLPPAISRLLNTLRQQALETRDPVMQNMQGRLTHVLQNTPPQDNVVDRILQALESFKNQIPGLSSLIGSVINNGMDQSIGNGMGPRGMPPGGPSQMGNPPRHGLLGTGPPGFNMMGPGNIRPPSMQSGPNMNGPGPGPNMQGWRRPEEEYERNGDHFGGPMMGNGGGNMNQSSFYSRGGPGGGPRHSMGEMRMGGPPWRGGGRGKKRGKRPDLCQHFVKKGACRFGLDCQFIHPGPPPDAYS